MVDCTVAYEFHDDNKNLNRSMQESCHIDVCSQVSPDWPLENHDIVLRILHCHPLTNSGTTIRIGLTRQAAEKLIDELLRGL